MNKLSQLIARINNKGLNTTIDAIVCPKQLLESNDRDKYLSATNYFFTLGGIAFFLQILVDQIKLEDEPNYYYVGERLARHLSAQTNFAEEYNLFIGFIMVIPPISLILWAFFSRYPFKRILNGSMYWMGTVLLFVIPITLILPQEITRWLIPPVVLIYLIYFFYATTYGNYFLRALKLGLTFVIWISIQQLFLANLWKYAYYQAFFSESAIYATPDPEIVPSTHLINNYSSEKHGFHWGELSTGSLFYTVENEQRKLRLFDPKKAQEDTISLRGRLIDYFELNADSLLIITAIKGNRDSLEYAQLTFVRPANLQRIKTYALPTEYYTINDASLDDNLWIAGAELLADKTIVPCMTRMLIRPDTINIQKHLSLNDQPNARGSRIETFENQAYLTTYKKENIYLYDLSLHDVFDRQSVQLFEKRTQFSPEFPLRLAINPTDGTIVTARWDNDDFSNYPDLRLFPKGNLNAPISVKMSKITDQLAIEDMRFYNDELHVCALLNFVIPSNYMWHDTRRYGMYLVIDEKGEIIEEKIYAATSFYNYTPVEFLNISDTSVSILGEEYRHIPVLGSRRNLIISTFERSK